jgi:formylglycine-generating enzyme required for sulfatase activity
MGEEELESTEEKQTAWLAAWDDALAGHRPDDSGIAEMPLDSPPELQSELAFVRELRRVLRPSSSTVVTPARSAEGSLPPPPEDGPSLGLPWSRLGRFWIRRELGRGQFGVVFLAFDPELQREVALKIPRAQGLVSPEAQERFRREAVAGAGLDHPNLVPVYDAGTAGPICFLVSAYCPGPTLAHWLGQRTEPMPPRLAAEIVAALASGVEHAHRRGVVHRDLKPGNVILSPLPTSPSAGGPRDPRPSAATLPAAGQEELGFIPRVTDFGLAKLLEGEKDAPPTGQLTASWTILGTPCYMAPEQAAGKARDIGPEADVYALGAILYELLTGRPPFRGETVQETLQQVQFDEPMRPTLLRPKLPRDLETICLKCLRKECHQRYPSAAELAGDLRRFLAGEPIHARPMRAWERARKWAKRRPVSAALLAGCLLALAGLLAGGVWHQRQLQAAHGAELVRSLTIADVAEVPGLVRQLDGYRLWADPLLARLLADSGPHSRERLHASLALLPVDPGQVEYLSGRLLRARPAELVVVCDALSSHRDRLVGQLWERVEDEEADPATGLRAACALARYAPDDPRWARQAARVADWLVAENLLVLPSWTELLRPARAAFLDPLARVFRDPSRPPSDRHAAAAVLSVLAEDRPEFLAKLVADADPRQMAVLVAALGAHREQAIGALKQVLSGTRAEVWPVVLAVTQVGENQPLRAASVWQAPVVSEAAKDALARRQARVAVALIHLGEDRDVWPLLKHGPDPRSRTELLHQLGPCGVKAQVIFRRLSEEPDVSVRRALILGLGEFTDAQLPGRIRESIGDWLLRAYRQDPDPGVHGAAEWLLRRWGKGKQLPGIDRELAGLPRPGDRQWAVNRQGQTLIVIPGPVEFLMGSPPDEANHQAREVLHSRRIPRSFAIASKETTVGQFRAFLRAHPDLRHPFNDRYRHDPDVPVGEVTWFEAIQYCRWLSEQEGIPEGQMCYPPVEKIQAAVRDGAALPLPDDHLKRTGYRLPTQAEWEYACRAGARTRRAYGNSDDLLKKYAWFSHRLADGPFPVGRLMPNDLGLFDMYGNVAEWCQDQPRAVRPDPRGPALEDREDPIRPTNRDQRLTRGGAWIFPPELLRSAYGVGLPSTEAIPGVGFRVARTWPEE